MQKRLEVLEKEFVSDLNNGLTDEQVAINRETHGENKLEEKEKNLIVEAGRTYVELNSASFNTTKCIALDTLVGADLLNEKFVVESIGSDYNSKYKIKVEVNSNGHDITLVSAGEC